jgi:hypothetical protein
MPFDLAANITPIIDGVVEILPSFLDLVIAMVPISERNLNPVCDSRAESSRFPLLGSLSDFLIRSSA